MGLLNLTRISVGEVGVKPGSVKMIDTNNLATITTAGYLNGISLATNISLAPSDVIECIYSYNAITDSGTLAYFQPSISNGVITLNIWENPGNVLLPVVSGDFAVFNGTTGQIKDAGYLPSNAAKTKVVMANGAVIANHIATYVDTSGTISDDAATAINGGNIQAGLSGTQGDLIAFPAGALAGNLRLSAIGNSGDFAVSIKNAIHGQATAYTFNDIGAATGGIPVSTAPFIMKQVAQAAVAGGAAAQTVTDAFCTSASNVIAVWNDTTNAVSIQKVAAGNGSFVVTSSADPGASHLNYIIMK